MSRILHVKVQGIEKDFDFYNFCKYILGYSKLTSIHKDWCNEADDAHKRKLFMKPRGTYKSTIYTVAYPIWKLLHNPNERILIANATADNAEAFLREITAQMIRNERFKSLFGEKLDPKSAKIANITIKGRQTYHKEPSINTVGVLGTIVSSHYSTIICDDLCNNQDRESESVREKKKKWFMDLLSILDPDGELIVVGTRWHFKDLYSFIMEELNPKLKPEEQYYISIESCYKEDRTPRFPNILGEEELERLKIEKGPIEFSSQYENVCLPQETQIFFESDFKTFDYLGTNRIKDGETIKNLDYFGYCDLALAKTDKSDFTAIITIGKSKDNLAYLVDATIRRIPPDQALKVILEKHKFFNYKRFGVESNMFQSLFVANLKQESTKTGVYIPIVEVGHTSNKALRIQSIQPLIKQGVLKIRNDWRLDKEYKELLNQFLFFPLYGHDDGPDATEGAFSMLRMGGKYSKTNAIGTTSKVEVSGYNDLDMSKFEITGMNDPTRKPMWGNNQLMGF